MGSLIAVNPAVEGMQQAADLQQRQAANGLARLKYDESRRTADAEKAVDDALREYILQGGGLGTPGADVGNVGPAAQAPAAVGEGGMPAASGVQGQTASGQKGSLAAVPTAPGPTATMGQGDVPGFQSVLQQVLPPQATPGQSAALPNAVPGATAGQPAQLPNATPGMQGRMVPLQDPKLPGTVPGGAAQTYGIDRRALAQRLAQVEGGGQAAMGLLQEQEGMDAASHKELHDKHDHDVTNFFASLDHGDVYSARYWANEAGMDLPDGIFQDAEAMRTLSIAGKYKQFYGNDLEGFGAFLNEALQRKHAGRPDAFQEAFSIHKPQRVAPQGRIMSPDNQLFDALVKKHGGDTVAAYTEWKQLGAKTGNRAPTTFEQRKAFAEKLFPNDPVKQGNWINGGRAPTGIEIRKVAIDELKAQYGNYQQSEEWDARLKAKMDAIRQEQLGGAPEDDGAGSAGDVASQMRIPTPDDNQAAYTMPDGTDVYSNDGTTWYDGTGNLVYGEPGN